MTQPVPAALPPPSRDPAVLGEVLAEVISAVRALARARGDRRVELRLLELLHHLHGLEPEAPPAPSPPPHSELHVTPPR